MTAVVVEPHSPLRREAEKAAAAAAAATTAAPSPSRSFRLSSVSRDEPHCTTTHFSTHPPACSPLAKGDQPAAAFRSSQENMWDSYAAAGGAG
eukprot:CAMPEP_0197449464 /NCGR_PEP_ID=MMETSP1175-20131217/21657_1 /TAXON_ID=1003142 /ORGANISM="Triceratium dubium, Strain CCMP147" /LENGTH=92 /DNA_ID=CAMNT_0042981607 /DNA_START=640 /DNA_END=915 /DNA_ORIENTATION=+